MMYSTVRPTIVALIVTTLAAGARTGAAQAPTNGVPAGEVRATGFAGVTVEPDLAIVTIQFSAAGKTPAIAGRAAARRANAIRAAIVALGIPKDSLPTTGRWGRWGNRSGIEVRNDMRDTSYVTNDAFMVRVRDLTLIGRVIDTALTEGAQTISNVEFQATNTEAAELDAIRRATRTARARAAAVAEASGLLLGRALDMGVDSPPMVVSSTMAMNEGVAFRMADAARATTVVAPELKVTINVSGRWEMVTPAR